MFLREAVAGLRAAPCRSPIPINLGQFLRQNLSNSSQRRFAALSLYTNSHRRSPVWRFQPPGAMGEEGHGVVREVKPAIAGWL